MNKNEEYPSGAIRSDQTYKARYDLVWWPFINELAKVLAYGSIRYGDRNWEAGMPVTRCFASCMRHLYAWFTGEDIDPETSCNHLAHAAFNLMAMMRLSNTDNDDRS